MSRYVLDASALLALLNEEEGAEFVKNLFPDVAISTVNLAEVVTRLSAAKLPVDDIREIFSLLALKTVPFDEEQAFQVGFLYSETKESGLSLGDRACLALAKIMDAFAVTADQVWKNLKIKVKIKLIR